MINQGFDFSHQVCLITGGTRGIGKQIADDLESHGASVLITGTNLGEIDSLNEAAKQQDRKKKYFAVDFSDTKSTESFLDRLQSEPVIDCLVNNAGINRLNYVYDAVDKDWDDMIAVNVSAPFKLLRHVAPKMIANKYGRVVNIASIFSKVSREKRSVYSTTKFGVHGLTVGSSNDLARYNVLVNTVSPGFVLTDLTRKNLSQQEMETLAKQIPSGRLAEASDISSVVLFLLSHLNTYVTGQNIVVDGGFTNV